MISLVKYMKLLEEYQKKIYKISWWIPIKKMREEYRKKKMNEFASNYLPNIKYKDDYINIIKSNKAIINMPYLRIYEEDTEENLERRKIIRDILINNDNENDLHNYFIENRDRGIHKWLFYFDIYEKHFSRFRGKDINILEIGVQNGGSTKMWKHYFTDKNKNNKVTIYGIDIDERVKNIEKSETNIKIFIGSQSNRDFLKKVKSEIPKVDILIDDGGHTMEQQIVTFEEMYEHVKDDGVYVCEDTHTSYWQEYEGGYKNPNSFIEYTKDYIDNLNIFHIREELPEKFLEFKYSTNSITYYDSIVVFEKKKWNHKYNDICMSAFIGKVSI